ncbi:MAG TPA: RNase A-like domain-containing protein [Polyangiales bacterium]|nr:RNase A-like domain-containing protein [Polyangiales bacterium]
MSEQEEPGIRIAMSSVQLAAVLAGETLDEPATFTNRVWGGLRIVGGTLELVGAGALCLAPEPTMASKAGCVVFGLHGSDTLVAGVRQAWTGHDTAALTQVGSAKLAQTMGADPATANRIGLAVDIGIPLAMSAWLGAARLASVRGGRIRLAEHEAEAGSRLGGHTIARHVGQTEVQLRARLTAAPRLAVVSTFADLRAAEDAISKVLQLEAAAIKTWAQSSNPNWKLELTRDLGRAIGTGVVRRTGALVRLTKVRIVLRYQSYNGMPYYVLTAYPVP